jgi:capsular exopolysaccharide synthesis family protein
MADQTSTTSDELDFTYYVDVMLRRRWIVLAAFFAIVVSTFLYTFTARPVYQASALLVIEKERGGAVQSGSMVENSNDDYYQTQYKLLQSRSLLQRIYDDLSLAETADFSQPRGILKLHKAVTISPVMRSRLVYVRVDSHDAKLAAAIANRLSDAFVEQNLANQLFISKEVLQALQAKGGDSNAADLPAVVNSPLIQSLKGEYAKLQSSYAELYARYTEKHPTVIRVKSSMVALDAQIRAETARIVASMKTELSGQLKGNNVRVIDTAIVPDRPIKPNKLKNIILGLVVGLVLGFALALFVEMIDQSLRTQDDVETKLGQPFLGVVPQAVVKVGRIYEPLLSPELSLTSESFRNLRTMVDFAGVGGKSKALLVTSTVQGEGKTYIAANLAVSFAQLGESILLIDGDLRRPRVHNTFGLSSEKGLSDYLVSGIKAEDAAVLIQKSEVPGLSILPCGRRPPNPSELLNTPRLGALISWARERYDRVIVDCTPMFPINDTLLWGRHIPSVAFVVRFGVTRTPLIKTACQKLQTGGIKILGATVNAAKVGGLSYSSYGYYYQQYYHSYHQEAPASLSS